MEENLDSIIEKISSWHLVLGVISLKEGNLHFKDRFLASRFREASKKYSGLNALFDRCGDGTSPEPNLAIENTLAFASMAHILECSGDYQTTYMSNWGNEHIREEIKEEYGEGMLDKLKLLADYIWEGEKNTSKDLS